MRIHRKETINRYGNFLFIFIILNLIPFDYSWLFVKYYRYSFFEVKQICNKKSDKKTATGILMHALTKENFAIFRNPSLIS